jgi:hypothetical protein
MVDQGANGVLIRARDHGPQRSGIRLLLIAAFVATIAWHATARADDILDRSIGFHIAASPLSSALIDFSTQSGLQVAAADADVSHLNSNGVNGTFAPRVALDKLLHGTGLGFSRVGATTVAIGTLPKPAIAAATRTGESGVAARTPEPTSPQPNPNVANPPEIPDITVMAPRPPTAEELAGDSLHQFIKHHATAGNLGLTDDLLRNVPLWLGGRRSICPRTIGLSPEQNAFVTERLRALATYVGAPVQPGPQCEYNVEIQFTNNPQEKMDEVFKWATVYFRNRYSGGMRDLIKFRSDHAIQGWYLMGGDLSGNLALAHLDVLPIWPQITQNHVRSGTTGTHLSGGPVSGIGIVILIIDTTKVAGYTIGTIADYSAMLTLSVAQLPDHCDPLPSILDLMSSSCGAREMPTAITAGDLAFMKALYLKNTGLGPLIFRNDIENNMMRQFKPR